MVKDILHGFADSINYAMKNPFGLDFVIQKKNIYVTLGSVINCIGYNDALERIVGVTRVAFGLLALALSKDTNQRVIASGQILRGILEMMGNFEIYLLVIDIAFTIGNISYKLLNRQNNQQPAVP